MEDTTVDRLSEQIVEFYEKLSSWEHGIAKNTGLSPQQNHTIEIVGSDGPIRMKSLAEKLGVTMGTLSVMVNRLEEAGYVYRQKDEEDGRGFHIILTDRGREIHEEHHAYHLRLAEDILSHLNDEDASSLINSLSKINRMI